MSVGRDRLGPGLTVAAMALAAVFLSPIVAFRFGADQGLLAHLGAEWLEGRWPYSDVWDHQFPGVMALHAAVVALFGRSEPAFRLFDFAWQLANAYLVHRIAGRLGGRAAAFLAPSVHALVYLGYGPWNTGQREGFAILFVLAGYWAFLTRERRSSAATAAWIGLGFGLALLVKPTLLALALFYLPLAATQRSREGARLLAIAATTALLPVAATALAFWWRGALGELFEACFVYQRIHVDLSRPPGSALGGWLAKTLGLGLQAELLALGYPVFLAVTRSSAMRERWMLYLGYLGALAAVVAQGTYAGYHYLPGLAIGAVMVSTIFERGVELVGLRGRRAVAAAAIVAVTAAPVYVRWERVEALLSGRFLQPPRDGDDRNAAVFDYTESWRLAAHLRERTKDDERIQVWGYEGLVYYLAERDAASRFPTSNPLVVRPPGRPISPLQRRWRAEFLAELARRPPAYVAVTTEDDWWWAPGRRTSLELLDDFPEWKRYLAEGYRLETTIGRFLVYRRLGSSAG